MIAVPAVVPVTMPVLPTVPAPEQLHAPSVVASLSVSVLLLHTAPAPVISAGSAFTVTIPVMLQPAVEI